MRSKNKIFEEKPTETDRNYEIRRLIYQVKNGGTKYKRKIARQKLSEYGVKVYSKKEVREYERNK